MITAHGKHKTRFAIFAILSLFLAAGPADLLAKGFRGGGGSRGGGRSSGGSHSPSRSSGKSFSFSGSSGSRSSSPKPSYDREAGRARQHEISAEKFNLWKSSRTPRETPSFNPSLAETRSQRMTSELGWRQPTGYYREPSTVVIYRDHYDNSFMKYVTLMWLFNHWNNVDHSRFDDARIRDLEARFGDLEARGYKRDPNYTEPGIDPDLAYHKDAAYEQHRPGSLAWLFWGTVGGSVLLWGIWFVFIRRVPYSN